MLNPNMITKNLISKIFKKSFGEKKDMSSAHIVCVEMVNVSHVMIDGKICNGFMISK